MTFELRYEFPDETLVSASELRFLTRKQIEERLNSCGLAVDQVLGDWDGSVFGELSPEMIFFARGH